MGAPSVVTPIRYDLALYGVVTAVTAANQFTIAGLANQGAGKFEDQQSPYQAFVFRDAGGAGAAPQGEARPVTGYETATGRFTTTAFTAAVAVGDEMLILHPSVANQVVSPTVVIPSITVPAGTVKTIYGNIIVTGDVNVAALGILTVRGDLTIMGNLVVDDVQPHSPLAFRVYGDLRVFGNVSNQGVFFVYGDMSAQFLANGCQITVSKGLFVNSTIENFGEGIEFANIQCRTLKTDFVDNGGTNGAALNCLGDVEIRSSLINRTGSFVEIQGNAILANVGQEDLGAHTANIWVRGTMQAQEIAIVGGRSAIDAPSLRVDGDLKVTLLGISPGSTGSVIVLGDARIGVLIIEEPFSALTDEGLLKVVGDCLVGAHSLAGFTNYFTINAGGKAEVGRRLQTPDIISNGIISCGSLDCTGDVDLTGAVSMTINGDARVAGDFTVDTATVVINGLAAVRGAFTKTTGSVTNPPIAAIP